MSIVFEAYANEFKELSAETTALMDELKATKSTTNNLKISDNITQLEDIIKQMNVEAKSQGSSSERKAFTERVTEFSATLTTLKSDFRRAQEAAGRSELIGERSAADRARVLDVNDKLERQNNIILNATRTVAETEDVGTAITKELASNRTKIESATEKSREFNGQMDQADKITRSMEARHARQCIIS